MQTQKMSLANIKGKLSRTEMKNIMAGSGGCCMHNASWSHYQCGYANAYEASVAASINAQGTGNHYYYCCASC